MNYFLAVNNPTKFNFRQWIRASPRTGYWRFKARDFEVLREGDVIFHYVTTADPMKQQGIHHRFVVVGKEEEYAPADFWSKGSEPIGKIRKALIDVASRRQTIRAKGYIDATHLRTLCWPLSLSQLGIVQGADSALLSAELGGALDREF